MGFPFLSVIGLKVKGLHKKDHYISLISSFFLKKGMLYITELNIYLILLLLHI